MPVRLPRGVRSSTQELKYKQHHPFEMSGIVVATLDDLVGG
jgi:hypothetical protein